MASGTDGTASAAPAQRDRTHWLYIAVVVAVFLGIVVGFAVANWVDQLDRDQLSAALSGEAPFDEATMLDDHGDVPARDSELTPAAAPR